MPSRIDRYRMTDGKTRLSAGYFNPIWQDIDLRLLTIESLNISWEEAVRQVSNQGLLRINEVLTPAIGTIDATVANAEQLLADVDTYRQTALANLAILEQAVTDMAATVSNAVLSATDDVDDHKAAVAVDIADWKASRLADIEAWKTENISQLNIWKADIEGFIPTVNGRIDTLESDVSPLLGSSTLGRALLKAATAAIARAALLVDYPHYPVVPEVGGVSLAAGDYDNDLAIVDGYGVYRYSASDTTIADGEIVIEPSSGTGRWNLVAPAWDFVWAYLAGLFDDLQGQMDVRDADIATNATDIATNASAIVTLTTFKDKFLSATATLDFPSIAAGASQTLTVTVNGAATGDAVIATPPATLPNGLVPIAYVSSADTVTIRLNNVTASAIDPASASWQVNVIKN